MIAYVRTIEGAVAIDVEDELVLGTVGRAGDELRRAQPAAACRGAAASGSTVVAVVDRRPPLLVSGDAGATWREAGGGLPPGFAVAIDPDDPDRVLYAARNRLYLSADGGRFWRGLEPELPDIEARGPGLRNPELAAGDDDRRAAHLDALDRRRRDPQAVA